MRTSYSSRELVVMELVTTAVAAAAGAALMYYLDPDTGRRRRALVRDKALSVSNDTLDAARGQGRRVANKVQGLVATSRARFRRSEEPVDEQTLLERVRACLGRVVDHPKAIDVEINGAEVRLRGDVLAKEVDKLLKKVERVRGVEAVENAMTVHESAENVPSLQGEPDREERRWRYVAWSLVAIAAPIAILATSVRPRRVWRLTWQPPTTLSHRLVERPLAQSKRAAQRSAQRVKDYFSELRTS